VIYAQLIAGFIYLLGGGDLLVRGAVALSRRLRVPSAFVALVVESAG
jgi:Ca2+/Na+ antiporter